MKRRGVDETKPSDEKQERERWEYCNSCHGDNLRGEVGAGSRDRPREEITVHGFELTPGDPGSARNSDRSRCHEPEDEPNAQGKQRRHVKKNVGIGGVDRTTTERVRR
jgi:hypothetical protein